MDEVGRGPLAGPLVATGVALNHKSQIPNLKDSKKLSRTQREVIYEKIIESGAIIKTEIITARQINNKGIGWANKEIFKRLIKKIEADKYIVDGPTSLLGKWGASLGVKRNVKCVIKADATRKCVMAASIVAKVTRDRIMRELHKEYPNYGWEINMGYGTHEHVEAIRQYGIVRYHRDVFVTTVMKKWTM